MAEKSFQEAVQVLKARMGGRWESAELTGREEMRDILKDQLGYSSGEADDAIDAMIAAGTLRYHRAVGADGTPGPVPMPIGPTGEGTAAGVPAAGGVGGLPLMPGMLSGAGYWEISDTDEQAPPGRGGQVNVDY
jgi:hypothetical protein